MKNKLDKLSELALSLAKSKGYMGVSVYRDWDGYLVFEANKDYKSDMSDFPEYWPYILANTKSNEMRWATPAESNKITIHYEQPPRL